MTELEIDEIPPADADDDRHLAGATVGMAIGTLLSRLTGVGRIIALAAAVGGGPFADAYNLANTTPNILTDIVIGGVLSATFVPVFVDYLTTRSSEEAWRAVSAVVTVTIGILVVSTVAFFLLAPQIVDLYTVTNHHADVARQQQTATFLLRWFVPQLACYGLIALFTALLNTRRKFAAPMFVPIANNLVVIAVLVWFRAIVPHPSLATIDAHHSALVVLAAGTTLGVVVQAGLLLPSLRRADLHLRVVWEPMHRAMRTIARLASWTFGFVLANQLALVVILALADGASVPGGVSAYTYAYTFFQLPYGVIAVSIMSAVTPSLAGRWATNDLVAFRRRMVFGLRAMLAIVIPSAVGMLILSHPLIELVLQHSAETHAQAETTAAALAMFSLGLPGFCIYLYMVRILQAMQDTKTAFQLYLVENGINVVLGIALVGPLGVRGLALSLSIAYTVAAGIAMHVIRGRVGTLGGDALVTPLTHVVWASAVMGVATVLALAASGASSGFGLFGRVVFAVVAGAVAYVAAAALLAHRTPPTRPGRADNVPPSDRPPPSRSDPPPRADPESFRGRLDDGPAGPSVRLLRPAGGEPGEEDGDGPDPGGDR